MVKEFEIEFYDKKLKVVQLDNGKFVVPDCIKELDGMFGGMQVKPAFEVVLVVMKPCSEKTFVEQALSNGHGGTWLGNCRIPYANKEDMELRDNLFRENNIIDGKVFGGGKYSQPTEDGRFPANLLISDNVLDNGEPTSQGHWAKSKVTGFGEFGGGKSEYFGVGEKDDAGNFSRYFSLDAWWEQQIKTMSKTMREPLQKTFPFIIEPKASKGEKNKGCEELEPKYMDENRKIGSIGGCNPRNRGAEKERLNIHPTVKPIDLMSYLIMLGSRKDEVVLDPFMGSGSTGCSCYLFNRRFIGMEISKEYFEIAKKRVEDFTNQVKLFS